MSSIWGGPKIHYTKHLLNLYLESARPWGRYQQRRPLGEEATAVNHRQIKNGHNRPGINQIRNQLITHIVAAATIRTARHGELLDLICVDLFRERGVLNWSHRIASAIGDDVPKGVTVGRSQPHVQLSWEKCWNLLPTSPAGAWKIDADLFARSISDTFSNEFVCVGMDISHEI